MAGFVRRSKGWALFRASESARMPLYLTLNESGRSLRPGARGRGRALERLGNLCAGLEHSAERKIASVSNWRFKHLGKAVPIARLESRRHDEQASGREKERLNLPRVVIPDQEPSAGSQADGSDRAIRIHLWFRIRVPVNAVLPVAIAIKQQAVVRTTVDSLNPIPKRFDLRCPRNWIESST